MPICDDFCWVDDRDVHDKQNQSEGWPCAGHLTIRSKSPLSVVARDFVIYE